MDNTDAQALEAIASQTAVFLKERLRKEFPYMKTETLNQRVESNVARLTADIEKDHPIMAKTKARVNFFSLPAEIRNSIYGMALHQDRENLIQHGQHLECLMQHFPLLLRVSRQVRSEAASIWFAETTFNAVITHRNRPGVAFDKTGRFFKAIGEKQAGMMRKVMLTFYAAGIDEVAGMVRRLLGRLFERGSITKRDVLKAYGFDVLGIQVQAVTVKTGGRVLELED